VFAEASHTHAASQRGTSIIQRAALESQSQHDYGGNGPPAATKARSILCSPAARAQRAITRSLSEKRGNSESTTIATNNSG